MIIYIDKITGDEVFADSFPHVIEDDVVYVVETENIVVGDESYVAANVDEDAEEGAKATLNTDVQTVNNLESTYRLAPTSFDKKTYMAYLKGYMTSVKEHLEKTNPERVAAFQKSAQIFAKKILSNFDEYDFYTTESMDPEGIILLKWWREEATTPTFYIWRDGLIERKL